jgi:hypothetical protein
VESLGRKSRHFVTSDLAFAAVPSLSRAKRTIRSTCIIVVRSRRAVNDGKKNSSRRRTPKTVLHLPELDQAKSAVLNSLNSAEAQRGYRHAIDEFVEWYCSEPRLSFNKTVVLRYRIHLESRLLSPGIFV